jgi:hypothetical protein
VHEIRCRVSQPDPLQTPDHAAGHVRFRATFSPRTPENIGRSKVSPGGRAPNRPGRPSCLL